MSEKFQPPLLAWFDRHARNLPWREAGPDGRRDPYRVWIAEALLQQTQVARGREYFERFLEAFPNVPALAAAPQEAVLKAWEGCGYYARARNLHAAARIVAENGFPTTYAGWLALPGVGPYTAAAVASIAHGEARAVVDGNVRRVLARLYAECEPPDARVQQRADALLYTPDPGRWNEAVMDLGATVCTPRRPRCPACPLQTVCLAFQSGQPEAYPAPKKRATVREVAAVALVVGTAHRTYLETRTGTLLGGLSGLPVEPIQNGEEAALTRLLARLNARSPRFLGTVQHAMTHRRVTLRVYAAEADLPLETVAHKALARLDQKALALLESAQMPLLGP